MLHGFGSQKDEVGNMYARLADALAARGVGSLRIDFRGFGKLRHVDMAAMVQLAAFRRVETQQLRPPLLRLVAHVQKARVLGGGEARGAGPLRLAASGASHPA